MILSAVQNKSPEGIANFAHEFTLSTLDGNPVGLRDFRRRRVLLNFWASWCKPCLEEMPLLENIHRKHSDRLAVVGINMREATDLVRSYVAELNITYPILLSPDDAVVIAYRVRGLPISFLIDENGRLIRRFDGILTSEMLEAIIRR